jgi:hypothetical protein
MPILRLEALVLQVIGSGIIIQHFHPYCPFFGVLAALPVHIAVSSILYEYIKDNLTQKNKRL